MGRRFMVPILIGCSLLVSVAALMGISHLWQRETLTVRDVQGSPSALEPYQMTGNWGDDFHNLSFTLSQGEIPFLSRKVQMVSKNVMAQHTAVSGCLFLCPMRGK